MDEYLAEKLEYALTFLDAANELLCTERYGKGKGAVVVVENIHQAEKYIREAIAHCQPRAA